MFASAIVRSTALVALLVPSVCLAQSSPSAAAIPPVPAAAPSGAPPAAAVAAANAPSAPPEMSAATRTAIDQRIRTLQSQLGITATQMPLWSAFAQTMRDNAASTDALFTRRAGAVAEMNAVDNMHSYAQIARAYADNTERLATAFDSLYASLSDVQKRAADTLFRQQAIAATKPQTRH
jgi:periplasmic protein CpxP/Spy